MGMFPSQSQFLEADLKTQLPKRLHFTSPCRINELVERGGRLPGPREPTTLELGISMGRVCVFLCLTDEQYTKLKRSRFVRCKVITTFFTSDCAIVSCDASDTGTLRASAV